LQKGLVIGIEDAMALYGTYTMWVYFTPVIGFWRIVGYRWAVVLGAGNDFGPHIDGSRNLFFYILELGFLL
jgi:POT family proton-dependent oligopeptide transporter